MSSSNSSTTGVSRRRLLGGAAALAGFGAAGPLAKSAKADGGEITGPLRVRARLQFVDDHRQQRFLWQSTKPPVFINGQTLPASARQGPDDGSWFIFNDENQNEKGGLSVSSSGGGISFDYPTVDAVSLSTANQGKLGAAELTMRQMPDPSIPIDQLKPSDAPERVLLGCDNAGDGALLWLFDSKGQPRIKLQVDGNDVPSLQILDATGNVVAQLPPSPAAPASQHARRRPLRLGRAVGRFSAGGTP